MNRPGGPTAGAAPETASERWAMRMYQAWGSSNRRGPRLYAAFPLIWLALAVPAGVYFASVEYWLMAGGGAIFWGIFALVNVERVGFCRLLDRHLNQDRPSDESPER